MKSINSIKTGVANKVKSLKTFNYNINLGQLILGLVVLFILVFGAWKLHSNKVNKLEAKYEAEVKLKNALVDTVHVYQNKQKEWVTEKLTIQSTIKNLEKSNTQLTQDQKQLIATVKELNRNNTVIVAALVKMQVKIDSLLLDGNVTVDTTKKEISFKDEYVLDKKVMKYDFTIGKVLPATIGVKPTLLITSLEFPNTQKVNFFWKDNKKEGYPVSFSVANSNDFFKTVNIESYAIPELIKDQIKPNGWQKIGSFFTKTGGKLVYIGIGAGIGVGGYILLTK